MRRQLTFFAFIGVAAAVNAGLTYATDDTSNERERQPHDADEYISYEITKDDGQVEVHEVTKQLVEEERKAIQTVEEVTKQLVEEEQKAIQTFEHMRLLLVRIFEIKQKLYSEQLDEEREQLLEELSVKTAALRELLRRHEHDHDEHDIRLIRLMEYLVVDIGMDFAVAFSKIGKSLATLYKEISP